MFQRKKKTFQRRNILMKVNIFLFFRSLGPSVDVCGKSLYVDLNELENYRRNTPLKSEATRKNAKSILLTEDVLSLSGRTLSPRHSYCDLEPDLIQVGQNSAFFIKINLVTLKYVFSRIYPRPQLGHRRFIQGKVEKKLAHISNDI